MTGEIVTKHSVISRYC